MCGDRPVQAQQAIPFEPDSVLRDPAKSYTPDVPTQPVTPISNEPATTDMPAAETPRPAVAEPDINKVHVEELSDRVVIHFPYNSTRKEEDAAIDTYLTRLASQLTSSGGKVTLTGHTDNVGGSKTNEAFAMRRAKNIRDILINKGVSRSQIICKSFGESKPVATNDTPRGRYQNRRVEIQLNQ